MDLPLLLRVAVRNTGSIVWPDQGAHPVNLSYHWLAPDGQIVDFDGLRANLPAPLPPGETAELELLAEPPPCAGDFLLALDMVEEGRAWVAASPSATDAGSRR